MMHVERRRGEVLKQSTRDSRPYGRRGEARHRQHTQRQHGGRTRGPDVPFEAPAPDIGPGDEVECAAADFDTLDCGSTEFRTCMHTHHVLRSQPGLAPSLPRIDDADRLAAQRRQGHRVADDGAAARHSRAIDGDHKHHRLRRPNAMHNSLLACSRIRRRLGPARSM